MRKITDKTQDINKELSAIKDMTAQFGDKRIQQLMEKAFKAGHQSHINQEKEKQEKIYSYINKHFVPLNKSQLKPVIYFIAERKRVFTSEANQFNLLYIGESEDWETRKKNYHDVDHGNNELVSKLLNKIKFEEDGGMWIDDARGAVGKFSKENKDKEERKKRVRDLLRDNVVVFILRRKQYKVAHKRIIDETRFINMFQPLINVGQVEAQVEAQRDSSLKDDLNECFTKEELQYIIKSVEEEQSDAYKYSHYQLSNQLVMIRTGIPRYTEDQVMNWALSSPELYKLSEKGLVDPGDVTLEKVNYIVTETMYKNKLNSDIAKELGIKTSVVNAVMEDLVKLLPIRKTTYFSFKYKALPKNSRIAENFILGEDAKRALVEEETVPQGEESRQETFDFTKATLDDIFNDFFVPGGERPTNGKL